MSLGNLSVNKALLITPSPIQEVGFVLWLPVSTCPESLLGMRCRCSPTLSEPEGERRLLFVISFLKSLQDFSSQLNKPIFILLSHYSYKTASISETFLIIYISVKRMSHNLPLYAWHIHALEIFLFLLSSIWKQNT